MPKKSLVHLSSGAGNVIMEFRCYFLVDTVAKGLQEQQVSIRKDLRSPTITMPKFMNVENYGERLLPQVLDHDARQHPGRIYATIAQSGTFETSYKDVTVKEMADAVNYVAWRLSASMEDAQSVTCLAYSGISDLRYPLICLAAMKCGLKVCCSKILTKYRK